MECSLVHYKQETKYSCAVACLRMVLTHFNIHKTEQELVAICDCLADGTTALKVVDGAKQLGLGGSRKVSCTFEQLEEHNKEMFPIIYLRVKRSDLDPNESPSAYEMHAVVIIKIDGEQIYINDPMRGQIIYCKEKLMNEWKPNYTTILIAAEYVYEIED